METANIIIMVLCLVVIITSLKSLIHTKAVIKGLEKELEDKLKLRDELTKKIFNEKPPTNI